MKKRFIDCDKWDDPWFRRLPSEYKTLWDFITCKCDNAGVWKVDFELARFMTGCQSISEDSAMAHFNEGKNRVIAFKDGYWHILGFVDFQFGGFDGNNNFHRQIKQLVQKHGLIEIEGHISPCLGALEEEEDKEKEKENIGEESEKGENPEKRTINGWFDELWQKYPNKDGKKHAKRHFLASVKTAEDFARISRALNHYLESKRVKDGFVKNGSTWFNDWECWVEYTEKVCEKCRGKGVFISATGYEIVCECPAGKGKS